MNDNQNNAPAQAQLAQSSAARARFKLKLALFCICLFSIALLAGLIIFFTESDLHSAIAMPVTGVSLCVFAALYLVLRQLFLNPLFRLHDSLDRFLNTGIRSEAKEAEGAEVFRNLYTVINRLIDAIHDEEASMTAMYQENQAKISFLSKISEALHGPMQEISNAATCLLSILPQNAARQVTIKAALKAPQEVSREAPQETSRAAYQESPQEPARELAASIREASNQTLELIRELVDYAQVESGQVQIENYPFRLDDVLTEQAARFQQLCLEKKLDFIYSVPPDIPQELVGDRTRFSQIIGNILDNAFKYTDSGEIFLGCTIEEKTARQVTLRFTARDTGLGMTPEEMFRLFTAFGRTDLPGRTGRVAGLGLGLAVTRKLVQLMGGDIVARSVQGRGTSVRFTISFGLYDSGLHGSGQDQNWSEAIALHQLRLLILDASQANRLAAYDLLKNWGIQVDAAETAAQAEEMLTAAQNARASYQLILLGQNLANPQDLSVAATLADCPALQKNDSPRPAVLLMGLGAKPDAATLAKYGINAFVQKPLTSSALLKAILLALDKAGINAEKAAQEQEEQLCRPDFTGNRLLLVEDNPINEQIACEILLELGVNIDVAHTGREALKLVQAPVKTDANADAGATAQAAGTADKDGTSGATGLAGATDISGTAPCILPYDLILMDIQMPEMDGVAATRIIRQDKHYDAMPIVAMTAHVLPTDLEDYMAAGMNGHVAKPIDIAKLYAELRRFLPDRSA